MKQTIALIILIFCFQFAHAQQPDVINQIGGRIKNIGGATSGGGKDTIGFVHRDDKKDSISHVQISRFYPQHSFRFIHQRF